MAEGQDHSGADVMSRELRFLAAGGAEALGNGGLFGLHVSGGI